MTQLNYFLSNDMLGSENLIGSVTREDLLKLCPPFLPVAGGGRDYVGGGQPNKLLKSYSIDVWRILELIWLCVCVCVCKFRHTQV